MGRFRSRSRSYSRRRRSFSSSTWTPYPFSKYKKTSKRIALTYGPISAGRRGKTGGTSRVPITASGAFGAPSIAVQTGRLPFARGGLYRLPYSESFAISASGTTGVTVVPNAFVLNGPYDPLVAIGGLQPMQWDQVAFMYQKYIVHKAKCTVTFNNPLYDGALVGLRVRSDQNAITTQGRTIAEVKEMDNTRSKWVNNTGNQTRSFSFTVRPWDIAGLSRVQYMCDRQDYQAAVNTNPTWKCWLEPFMLHTVAGEDNVIRCTVRIIYYVQFMEGQTKLDA